LKKNKIDQSQTPEKIKNKKILGKKAISVDFVAILLIISIKKVAKMHIFTYLCIVTSQSLITLEGQMVVIGSEVGL